MEVYRVSLPHRRNKRLLHWLRIGAIFAIVSLVLLAGYLLDPSWLMTTASSLQSQAPLRYATDRRPVAGNAALGVGHVFMNSANTMAADATPAATATAQPSIGISSGALDLSTVAAPVGAVTLTGVDQSMTFVLPMTVTDARGSGAGWNLTMVSTQFSTTTAPTHLLPADAAAISGVQIACVPGATCTAVANGVTYPLGIPTGTSTPVKFFNAAAGTGMGTFTVTPSITVSIPANAFAGTYSSVVTLAVISGP